MSGTVTSIPLSPLLHLVPGLSQIVSKCEKKEWKSEEGRLIPICLSKAYFL